MESRMNTAVNIVVGSIMLAVIASFVLKEIHRRREHRDLLADETLALECAPAEGTDLHLASACAIGDEVVVSGCLRRKPGLDASDSGRLVVTLVSPDATVLERQTTSYAFPSGAGSGDCRFSVRLHSIPPEGSTARIEWGPGLGETEQSPPEQNAMTGFDDPAENPAGGLP